MEDMMGMGEEPEEGMEGGDYVIEIRVSGGGITVSTEPAGEEEMGESEGTPAKSIGDAMKMVMDIYENGGESGTGDEDFDQGYGSPVREGE